MQPYKTDRSGIILSLVLCIFWLAVTMTMGVFGFYEYFRNEFYWSILVTVVTPTIFFLVLFLLFPNVRVWTQQSLNLAMLTLPHAWRTLGFAFLVLWFYGVLPAGFAAPAGFGDFLVGMAAPFVAIALWLQWKNAIRYTIWLHVLGFADLFIALFTGMSAFGVQGEKLLLLDPMTAFPLVIVPTAFVPLLILSHVMVLVKILMDRNKKPSV